MKIVGVSFGGRDGANDSMCRAALLAAQEEGAEVKFIHLLDWDIKYCTGCVSCSKALVSGKGNICIIKDEFDEFRSILLDADGVLFCTPIFEKGGPGLLHTICDRFGPRIDRGMNIIADKIANEHGGKPIDQRLLKDKVISFIGIGGSDWSTRIQCDHGMVALSPMWKVIDNERFSWSKNIILEDDKVARVREIGKNLAHAAADIEHAKYKGVPGVCPHCHSNEFYLDCNSQHAICCLCGIEGDIVVKNGKVGFEFPSEQLQHAHDTLSGKFLHADDIKGNETTNMANRQTDEYKKRVAFYKQSIVPISPPSKR